MNTNAQRCRAMVAYLVSVRGEERLFTSQSRGTGNVERDSPGATLLLGQLTRSGAAKVGLEVSSDKGVCVCVELV